MKNLEEIIKEGSPWKVINFLEDNIPSIVEMELTKKVLKEIFRSPNRNEIINAMVHMYGKSYFRILEKPIIAKIILMEKVDLEEINPRYYSYLSKIAIKNNINPLLLDKELLFKLLQDSNFAEYFNSLNMPIKDFLYSLSIDDYINGLLPNYVFKNDVIHDINIQNRFLSISNPALFRVFMNKLYENNSYFYEILNSKRKKLDDKRIASINENGLLEEFKRGGKNENKKRVIEIFIDHYFEDIPINFLLNLKNMMEYINKLNVIPIPLSHMFIYQRILDVLSFKVSDIVEIYNSLGDKDFKTMFYEDFRKIKDMQTMSFIEVANMDEANKKINIEATKEYDIPTYDITDRKFYALIHAHEIGTHSLEHDNTCLTLISNKSVTNYSYAYYLYSTSHDPYESALRDKDFVILGFNSLNPELIKLTYISDTFNSQTLVTDKIYSLLTPQDFMKNTIGYNEIIYHNGKTPLTPDYILAYDTVTEYDKKYAKHYNVPIYILNTKKYGLNTRGIFYHTDDDYDKYNGAEDFKAYSLELKHDRTTDRED